MEDEGFNLKKRTIAAILCVIMIACSMATVAYARASNWLSTYNITVGDRGNGTIRVTASVDGTYNNLTRIGFPTVVLYEKINGVWSAVRTNNSIYAYNTGGHAYQYNFTGVVGREYRAYASFTAEDSTGGDMRTAYSGSVTLR